MGNDASVIDLADHGKTHLSLTEHRLSRVPPAVYKLGDLTFLNLSRNPIRQLPDRFGELPFLQSLFCNTMRIERVPPSLGTLQHLTTLSIQNNRLVDVSMLTSLPSLTELELQNNQIAELPV